MGKGYTGCRPDSKFPPSVQLSCQGQILLTEIHIILKDTLGPLSLSHPWSTPIALISGDQLSSQHNHLT